MLYSAILVRHGRSWRHSGRIAKAVDRQCWWTVFREHNTSYVVHNALSRTSSVLTPSPYPRSSLSLTLRSFGFLRRPTPTDLVTDFVRPYDCTVCDCRCRHFLLSCPRIDDHGNLKPVDRREDPGSSDLRKTCGGQVEVVRPKRYGDRLDHE